MRDRSFGMNRAKECPRMWSRVSSRLQRKLRSLRITSHPQELYFVLLGVLVS